MKSFLRTGLFALLSVLLLAGTMPAAGLAKKPQFSYDQYSQVDVGKDGMVATAHPLASEIGAEVLRKGGNAIDAAVAIQFALTVVEPMMSGIGTTVLFCHGHEQALRNRMPPSRPGQIFHDAPPRLLP